MPTNLELLQAQQAAQQAQQAGAQPAITQAAPVVPEAPQVQEQPGIVEDLGTGVVAGVQGFAQSALDLVTDVGHAASLGLLGDGEGPQLPEVDQPQRAVGHLAKGITQFAIGMLPATKLVKAVGIGSGLAQSMVAGGVADFVAFDEGEARLSNLLVEADVPILNNAVTQYLAADADDSWAEGRFKNVIEGLGLGAMTEVLYRGVRMVKHRPSLEGRPGRTAKEVKGLDDALKTAQAPEEAPEVLAGRSGAEVASGIADDGTLLLSDDVISEIGKRTARAVSGEQPWENVLKDLPLPSDATKFTDETITGLMDQIGGAVRNASGGPIWDKPQTLNTVRDVAIEMGQDPNLVIKQLGELGSKREVAAASIVAGRNMQNELARRFIALSGGNASHIELQPVAEALARTTKAIREAASTGGRTVSAFRVEAASDGAQRLGGALDEFLATGNLGDLQKAAQTIKDPGVISRFLTKLGLDGSRINQINEYWINAILSGPKTHAVNMASNTFMSLTRPLEDALGNLATGRWAEAVDSMSMYNGLIRHTKDSFKMAGRAWVKDGNVLDPIQTVFEHQRGSIPGPLGTVVRTPTRALAAEDEFFKQINYRARIHVKASKEGLANGLRGRDLAEYIDDKIAKSLDETGAALDEEAMKYAERVTFTSPLGDGTYGQGLQEYVERHPALRQVFPFIRTPTNLLREAWFHLPGFGLLGQKYRAQWASSPAAKATMVGRQMVGTMALSSVFALAVNGRTTGGAPKDPALRQAWFAEHPAYSIKIGDNWYPYDRGDPLGILFGLAADWVTIAAEVTPADADEVGSAMMMAVMERLWGDDIIDTGGNVAATMGQALMAAARTVKDKTYFQSLSDILDVVDSGDEDQWGRFVRNRIGSFVPNLLRQTNPDPYFRQIRTWQDALLSRIPGFSDKVEPRFDALGRPTMRPGTPLGRLAPTMPISSGHDPVFAEMNRLQLGFNSMPDKRGEIDMTRFKGKDGKSVYYKLNEKLAASGLQQQLEKLISSPGYKKLSDNTMAGLEDVLETGSKAAVLRKVINQYRDLAFNQLLAEGEQFRNPKTGMSLLKAYQNDKTNRGLAMIPGQQLLPTQ